ncbi:hypothetical protein OPT61_g2091 [Boeremia exigua]|uniref:Uncharacterized protein n=1 Tax=Boeremia exigua TaxID=749465 RepID=A0ACC2IMQ6_9PLEO|nr:hypothetical protein OPT61_g2091 [Boeremia exigua]
MPSKITEIQPWCAQLAKMSQVVADHVGTKTQAPHLLTLPREIRNLIYEHLFHEISLRELVQSTPTLFTTLKIHVDNAPLSSVLLVHSQLRDEYLETGPFHRLSITISSRELRFLPHFTPQDLVTFTGSARGSERMRAVVRRSQHVNIHYMNCTPGYTIQDVINLFTPDFAVLRSLRVAVWESVGSVRYNARTSYLEPLPPTPDVVLDDSLAGLSLVQRGACFGLSHNQGSLASHISNTTSSPSWFYHTVGQITFAVYASGRSEPALWDERVVKHWKSSRYPVIGQDRLSEEQVKRLKELPGRAYKWSAQRVGEVEKGD